MTEHSNIIGGSSAERRINCPGSYKLELPYPNTSSEFAEEGTACHEAMEYILLNECPPTEVIGKTFNKGNPHQPEGYVIDDSEDGLYETKIRPAWEAWQEIIAKYGAIDFVVEARCDLSSVIPGAFGTVDVLGQLERNKKVKVVLDWKFGSGVSVAAKGNYQCGFYAAAALHTQGDDDVKDIMKDAELLLFIIVQPDKGEMQYSEWETPVHWAHMVADLALAAVNKSERDNAPIKPGKHCRWCKAKADCSAQKDRVDTALSMDPLNTTSVERAYWLSKADELSSWVYAIRNAAHEDLTRGVSIPGYKLVEKRAARKWAGIEENKLAKLLTKMLGKKKAYKEPELISAPQAEKELRRQFTARKEKRGAWKGVFKKELEPYIEKKSSGTTTVADSDSREAIVNISELLGKALDSVKKPDKGLH